MTTERPQIALKILDERIRLGFEGRGLVRSHPEETVALAYVPVPSGKSAAELDGFSQRYREYNLALGQKRADAVRKALSLLGVSESQIESVSLGEEKPSCTDAAESCWSANRRGDMLYSGEF